ncbi:MAG: 1,3-beta-glucanase, partial [Chloroflexota bacterium]|nr:1,3-beta-glucanase [Chloroflexota bacterium]
MHTFPQGDQATSPQPRRTFKALRGVTLLALIVASLVAAIGVLSSPGIHKAHAATWTPVWSDNFDGAAGTGLNTSNWLYDTGTGWGTGEIETMSSSTANVQLDGSGHLKITAIRDANGNWTSGRVETQRADFAAPVGGQLQVSATIQQPNVSG